MIAKFDRILISSINEAQVKRMGKQSISASIKTLPVPEKETFKHIFENAKKGNEMAAVLLDEWQKSCKPKDSKEDKIVQMINMAAGRIFK